MGVGHRRVIEAAGWTREQTQSFLFQRCHRKVSDVRAKGFATTPCIRPDDGNERSEEHTSELQSLMRISYAVFCLKKKKTIKRQQTKRHTVEIIYISNDTKYHK